MFSANLKNISHMFKKTSELEAISAFFKECIDGIYKIEDYEAKRKVELVNGIFGILQTYSLKDEKDAFFESHLKYIDFQLTLRGSERFLVGDIKDFEIKTPYDEKKDFIEYKPNLKVSRIVSKELDLNVFLPYDVHAGGIYHEDNNIVKVVVKAPKELIKLKF
ncbi:hypothetical protein BKH43_00785 [Helicobacter sp. 13S00401-1]|uniref:YhcH/YjgK/YiaL family protein n=1 Tax=Helicobacter sp. 13S00401-1 TaxID=1905758 RepID=UPI000BA7D9AD|nr:YhcH/YjgK/YiaL family protein [Helicobacter sp. 13S00401-1]PAF51802.1 hypothetical protein BKH43_00785 [Helicobacter sp. 13S00401-1]